MIVAEITFVGGDTQIFISENTTSILHHHYHGVMIERIDFLSWDATVLKEYET